MTWRGLFVGDVHMSNGLPYSKPTADGRTDRLEDQLALWKHIKKKAKELKVSAIFILGDLFDKAVVDPVTLSETAAALKQFSNVYLLPGNHDAASLKGGRFTVEAFGVLSDSCRVVGMDPPEALKVQPWLHFWPLAFMPMSETREALKGIREAMDEDVTNVLLFHNSVEGAKHMGWVCDDGIDGDELCEGFDWVLSGHFHEHQSFGSEDEGMYLSAPMHHDFRDVGRQAGYWVIEFGEEGEREDTFVDPGLPQFHVFTDLDTKAKSAKRGDYVRLEVPATHADWIKLKPKAEEACARLEADGIRADYKHKPIYHHKTRLKKAEGKAKLTLDDALEQYVEASDVVIGGLDPLTLKRLGRDILASARDSDGPV